MNNTYKHMQRLCLDNTWMIVSFRNVWILFSVGSVGCGMSWQACGTFSEWG